MNRCRDIVVGLMLVLGAFGPDAHADPCGMIPPPPPPYLQHTTLIERVGAQKTYVFYKNGIESFVIRPGFKGKISNFGMLIPFPSPPAIRKVPDEIFSHLTSAIDPPEVVVRLQRFRRWGRPMPSAPGAARSSDAPRPERKLRLDEVRVVRREAVGMYQVAVLQAGSPKALKRWMKKNGYVYPKGMDKVCYEYIEAGWTFVAVKARVAGKSSVAPHPGMRSAKAAFPVGGSFAGNVQAMGFRFRSRKLVVPMRLSAFNKGKLRNIVYLLTDGPKRIRRIPQKYVMRQVPGKALFTNVTEPLPLRIIGGTIKMIGPGRWQQAQRLRNPQPHNGHAKELFASDLLAARQGKLSLHHEREKKVLLRIGERLRLRSKHLDKLNRQVLQAYRDKAVKVALGDLRSMTLTVIDGDFKREVIAADNLTFASYRMPRKCNSRRYYNTRTLAHIACSSQGFGIAGLRYVKRGPYFKDYNSKTNTTRRRRKRRGGRYYYRLIKQLSNAKRASQIVAKLVKDGTKATPFLLGEAIEGNQWTRRGWSIVALADIASETIDQALFGITRDNNQHLLVRNWSAAAYLKRAKTVKEMLNVVGYTGLMPALQRPIRMRVAELVQQHPKPAAMLFSLAGSNSSLHSWIRPLLNAQSVDTTLEQMLQGHDLRTRQIAASYASAHMNKDSLATTRAYIKLMRFQRRAKQAPWFGGALYMPGWPTPALPRFNSWTWRSRIQQIAFRAGTPGLSQQLKTVAEQYQTAYDAWQVSVAAKQEANKSLKQDSRTLIHQLLAWGIWSQQRNLPAEERKVLVNLASPQLTTSAGIGAATNNTTLEQWLLKWHKEAGEKAYQKLLRTAGVANNRQYTVKGINKRIQEAAERWQGFLDSIYLGCYQIHRRQPGSYQGYTYSVPVCRQKCAQKGYTYASLTQGHTCYCANQFPSNRKLSENQCNYPCSRSPKYKCGGYYKSSIYKATGPTKP